MDHKDGQILTEDRISYPALAFKKITDRGEMCQAGDLWYMGPEGSSVSIRMRSIQLLYSSRLLVFEGNSKF